MRWMKEIEREEELQKEQRNRKKGWREDEMRRTKEIEEEGKDRNYRKNKEIERKNKEKIK